MLFSFVRHGEGCHNFLRTVRKKMEVDNYREASYEIDDPELTKSGIMISQFNGKRVRKQIPTENVTFVCCSPLIRSMETAYYMTRLWKDRPKKIYIVPYLREIDENTLVFGDKNSPQSRKIIDEMGVYKMKSLDDQKRYLQNLGILKYFDFSFIEKIDTLPPKKKYSLFGNNNSELLTGRAARSEPGDLLKFMKWVKKYMLPQIYGISEKAVSSLENEDVNFFVVTHAGVLKDFAMKNRGFVKNAYGFLEEVTKDSIGFYNNGGFYLNFSLDNEKVLSTYSVCVSPDKCISCVSPNKCVISDNSVECVSPNKCIRNQLTYFGDLYTKISDIEMNAESTTYNCTNNNNRCNYVCKRIQK
jgi:hypothetical protein